MEMQGAPTGINDGVTAILVTSAKAPIKVGKRVFFEVAFRTTRPCQNMFELIETLGIDLVSDNDQSGIGPSARWTLSAHEQGVREKPRHRGISGKLNGVCAKVFDPFSASMALVSTISETGT